MFCELLEKIARALETKSFNYMLIGGQAVLLYGEPRLTQDVDITLGAGPERLSDLLEIANKYHWKILVKDAVEFVRETMVLPVQDTESGIRIDFIFSFSPFERQALKNAREVQIGQTKVRFASPEDLVVHKIIAGRPRDLEDIRGILLKNQELNRTYISHWLRQFAEALNQPFVEQFEQLWIQTHR